MTFVIKQRGATSGKVLADFRCPVHGVFEVLADRDAERVRCRAWTFQDENDPEAGGDFCGEWAAWTPSVVFGRVQEVSATQGKAEPKPHAMSMDLREVGEGRSLNDWKKERRAKWRELDYKRRKDEGRIP